MIRGALRTIRIQNYLTRPHLQSLSLYYYDLTRIFFLILFFSGILSTGWFGIPLAPHYFTDHDITGFHILFTILSFLSTIWGIMAYREFTRYVDNILLARDLCKKLDPTIGDYNYSTFNPATKKYVNGFVHFGPTDFWDRETLVPDWLDKGKYWHIFLSLQTSDEEIILKVDNDSDLLFFSGKKIVANTSREFLKGENFLKKKYQYIVTIPQWLVMTTDAEYFTNNELNINATDFGILINSINKQISLATNIITEHEKKRIKYSWILSAITNYLFQSLPIKILYKEIYRKTLKYMPTHAKQIIDETNLNLSYVNLDELSESLLILARMKNIKPNNIEKIRYLILFLKNMYEKQGLGEGSNRYHNFHHSLEVSYVTLQILPKELHGHYFIWEDYEFLLIAGLLHDYDPYQQNYRTSIGLFRFDGPKVERTVSILSDMRIIDAYYSMDEIEFKHYFQQNQNQLLPPIDYVTTHAEYVKSGKLIQTIIVEAMIWRTDYPFKQKLTSMKKYVYLLGLINDASKREKYDLMSQILWLADLSVTYMGSDPISTWERVTNLYNELFLPKFEAISKTDKFFSEFMDIDIFKELINNRNFPDIFRQRWNLVYQFYHEGNSSNQINRIIVKTKKSYSKINLEIGLKTGDLLFRVSSDHPEEYFIGIDTDQESVINIKNRISVLKPQNATIFWGDAIKLLPNIYNNSIDNIFFNFSTPAGDRIDLDLEINKLHLIFHGVSTALKTTGIFQLLINLPQSNEFVIKIVSIADRYGLQICPLEEHYVYFPKYSIPKEYFTDSTISVLLFKLKT